MDRADETIEHLEPEACVDCEVVLDDPDRFGPGHAARCSLYSELPDQVPPELAAAWAAVGVTSPATIAGLEVRGVSPEDTVEHDSAHPDSAEAD